jgi:predicted MFS family arabinose efflux permease
MKLSRLIYVIAVIIVGVWVVGLLFKLAAWFVSSLLYIAAVIVIIGLVRTWWEQRKANKNDKSSK